MERPLAEDLALLKSAVEAGAAVARDLYLKGTESWDKGRGEPVTEADLAVDELLKQRLLGARPDYGWLSEETTDDPKRLAHRKLFIVDPIDGTSAFIKHRPQWTVCAALIVDGAPAAGVVANPMTAELFEAMRGGGARLNAAPIHVSGRAEIEGAALIGTKGFFTHPSWPEPWPASITYDNPNSLAYRLCLIAAGKRDGAVRLFSCHEWDIAAADIIVREAGGIMTDHEGAALVYNRQPPIQRTFVAAGPGLHGELLRRAKPMVR